MRVTAIQAETERKRQDRSVRHAEKRHCQAGTLRVHGPIRPTSGVCATTDTAQGGKRLFSWHNQAILPSDGWPLGECRWKDANIINKMARPYQPTEAANMAIQQR